MRCLTGLPWVGSHGSCHPLGIAVPTLLLPLALGPGGKGSQLVGQGAVLTQRMAQPCPEVSPKLSTFEYVATFCRDLTDMGCC